MAKITGSINAFVMPTSIERMRLAVREGDTELALACMSFTVSDFSTGESPWPLVGRATVTVEIPSDDVLRAGVLDALNKQRERVVAEKVAEVARIDDQIKQLLAITCEVQS